MFSATKGISRWIVLVVAMATPSTIALSLYVISGNPYYRPLGITEEAMTRIRAPVGSGAVEVLVHWAPSEGDRTAAMDLGREIKRAFTARGVSAWVVVLEDYQAPRSYVSYRIGGNELGPYPIRKAAQGVRPAIDAARALYLRRPDLDPANS